MSALQETTAWVIAALTILGVVLRPWRTREWMWAVGGAALLVCLGLLGFSDAARAIGRGANVYAFLVGIMALAALARHERVFDWAADSLLMLAGGSRARLFALIYGLGAAVTIFLSNDATVILLTPAIFAIVGDGVGDALPYLFACALVANAASFTLSISNPANLVIFGHALPRLFPWMQFFGLSAVASMAVTFVALCWYFRRELRGSFVATSERTVLGVRGRLAVCLTVLAAIALVAAAATGISVGLVALGSALVAVAAEVVVDRSTARYVASHIAWQVVPLVAGLFVVVAGLERVGATADIQRLFAHASSYGEPAGAIAIGGATALASDLFNNLPVALAGGVAVTDGTISPLHAHAMTVAINLGSNFATTGSLATLLWLILLRQHKVTVTPLQFFRVGAFVTVPALLAALLLVR